jgi:hypothetical protein
MQTILIETISKPIAKACRRESRARPIKRNVIFVRDMFAMAGASLDWIGTLSATLGLSCTTLNISPLLSCPILSQLA